MTEEQAIAAGYPSTEQYLSNKEWYNSQGYFGLESLNAAGAGPGAGTASRQGGLQTG